VHRRGAGPGSRRRIRRRRHSCNAQSGCSAVCTGQGCCPVECAACCPLAALTGIITRLHLLTPVRPNGCLVLTAPPGDWPHAYSVATQMQGLMVCLLIVTGCSRRGAGAEGAGGAGAADRQPAGGRAAHTLKRLPQLPLQGGDDFSRLLLQQACRPACRVSSLSICIPCCYPNLASTRCAHGECGGAARGCRRSWCCGT
jgi:hypothetical protein